MMNIVHYFWCIEVWNHGIDTYAIKKYKKYKDTILMNIVMNSENIEILKLLKYEIIENIENSEKKHKTSQIFSIILNAWQF